MRVRLGSIFRKAELTKMRWVIHEDFVGIKRNTSSTLILTTKVYRPVLPQVAENNIPLPPDVGEKYPIVLCVHDPRIFSQRANPGTFGIAVNAVRSEHGNRW